MNIRMPDDQYEKLTDAEKIRFWSEHLKKWGYEQVPLSDGFYPAIHVDQRGNKYPVVSKVNNGQWSEEYPIYTYWYNLQCSSFEEAFKYARLYVENAE